MKAVLMVLALLLAAAERVVALSCDSYSMFIAKAQVEMRRAGEDHDRKAVCDAARDAHHWVVTAVKDDCRLTNASEAITAVRIVIDACDAIGK